MDKRERKETMAVWGVRDESPRERRAREALDADLQGSPLRGKAIRQRLRNFKAAPDSYIASLGGPLPYMQRLREIDELTRAHERALAAAREELAAEDPARFAERWRRLVERWDFSAVNALIDLHNRWYPIEARLPMDPKTRDFALVNGKPYRREPLGPAWALARFPDELAA